MKIIEKRHGEMKALHRTMRLVFPCPELPEGYTLKQTEGEGSIAVSPEGKEHLIVLNPPRLIPIVSIKKSEARMAANVKLRQLGRESQLMEEEVMICDFENPILI